jgi:predicted secreted acid phosphatase
MNSKMPISKNINTKHIIICITVCVLLIASSVSVGYFLGSKQSAPQETKYTGYAPNPEYEYMVGSAAWQMSAEAHALMMQGFYIAEKNIDEIVSLADNELNGYRWVEQNGDKKLYLNEKRVCVVCDIDDTLVDGVHYTANILGKNGEWRNKAFTYFIQSKGCTALPGAVAFANH